ncbi:MAG: PASTA domain-containing protein, partial [Berryella intestinalis]|nr:PASTA domain-containing protein [Berryella intestinalis]
GEAVVPAATAPRPVWNDGRTIEFPRVADEEKPRSKDFLASDSKKKRLGRGKVALLAALVLLALAAVAAAATYQMELWGGKTVPDVTGLTQSEAQAVLGDAGFSVKALQVKSDEPEGLVLVMDPEAGERQGEGTEVIIHVSTARIVPDIAGKSKEDAERQLKDEGFGSVTFAEEKSDEPEGTVLGVSPAPGERAASTTEIQVTVAIPYTVPDVSGKSADAAQKALEEAGYRCEIQYSYSDQVDNGTVLGCSPSPGSKLESGSTVVLNVSKSRGAELVAAVQAYVYKGQRITVGGVSYEVQSLSGVKYIGNNQTSVQFVGKPFMSFLGETVSLSARDVEAVITWTESNTVASVS